MPGISRREREAILRSLGAGVVPAIGLQHIQVGRLHEVSAMVQDLDRVEDGCSAVRFIVGPFGSGKTFFLNLIRTVALKRGFLVLQADITTDRLLSGSRGQARSLYCELMRNLATRARPEGGALSNVVERWVSEIDFAVRQRGGSEEEVKTRLADALKPLQEMVGGFDFVTVLTRYYEGYLAHDEELQDNALRWLRAEYSTKTEARKDLGVRQIINDDSFYDHLKLFAAFAKLASYSGALVNIDEMVVLSHRLTSSIARNNNYEALLQIINDCLQGHTEGLAFLFAATDASLNDRRRGLSSYEALATRLAPNRFAVDGLRDFSTPVIELEPLSPEDCYVLLTNIRNVFARFDPSEYPISDAGIVEYLKNCSARMGAAYFQTPRDTVKDFVGLLSILRQNPSTDWQSLLGSKRAEQKGNVGPDIPQKQKPGDGLVEFRL